MKARENPFRVEKLHGVCLRLDWSIDEIFQKLESSGWKGAIVGDHGSGKTRFLNELEKEMRRRSFLTEKIFLTDNRRTIPWGKLFFHSRKMLLIDGAEQLMAWEWFLLRLLARGLVITCHKKEKLPVLIEMKTSVELLEEIVKELSKENFWKFDCEELFRKHRGNIRDALRECFDLCFD